MGAGVKVPLALTGVEVEFDDETIRAMAEFSGQTPAEVRLQLQLIGGFARNLREAEARLVEAQAAASAVYAELLEFADMSVRH
jgi:hypothetical protein